MFNKKEYNHENLSKELKENGILVIHDFLDEERCNYFKNSIQEMIEGDVFQRAEQGTSYRDLAEADMAILNKRDGKRDSGMIDIFNIDYKIKELKKLKDNKTINEIINTASDNSPIVENINIYYNRSIENTRGYHLDTYQEKFKAFIYLTDVNDSSFGPYSYIKGSQAPNKLQEYLRKCLNKFILRNKITDAIKVKKEYEMKCLGEKGTLIISNQTGYHRGWPQQKGKERMLISISFRDIS